VDKHINSYECRLFDLLAKIGSLPRNKTKASKKNNLTNAKRMSKIE